LDPRVYQSGSTPAKGGRISKQGSPQARWALVEAAWSVVQQPGPLHAFYERIRARRGHAIAVVACARKLAVLFWCLLSRGQDYAHQQPSLTAKKLRLLEIRAGAPTRKGTNTGVWATRQRMRKAERELAQQAEASYKRTVSDWQAAAQQKRQKAGASVTPGRA
jgi:transposase